jgi:hypothetical protein
MLLLAASWQALAGPTRIHPKPKVAGARVQRNGYSLGNEEVDRLRQPARAVAPPAGKLSKLPLSFEANQGQAIDKVKFLSHGQGYGLFLTGDEAVLELQKASVVRRPLSVVRTGKFGAGRATDSTVSGGPATDNGLLTTDVLRLKLVDANPDAAVLGAHELPGKVNYFLGNDPAKWRGNLPTFAEVRYRNVYPGIDLIYHGDQDGRLEYDFVVAPGADPNAIALDVGAGLVPARGRPQGSPLRIDRNGSLVISTGRGEIRFNKPRVYQGREPGVRSQKSGEENQIGELKIDPWQPAASDRQSSIVNRQYREGRFTLDALNHVRFALGPYDHTRPLVIDPSLTYSTYLGGAGDQAKGVAVDSSGNAYVTGATVSTGFPLANPLQSSNKSKSGTAFVSKLNSSGSALVYSTYLGGSVSDQANAIAVDPSGEAYVTGSTCSSDFPTVTPVQAGLKGVCDGFVAELNAAGSSLVYSTYLGGSGTVESGTSLSDEGVGIAVDSSGAAYVTGGTWSTDFPTVAPIQSYGGGEDAFLSKFSAGGATLVYSTYLGGTAQDQGNGIAVDSSGNAYVTGFTLSSNFPTVSPFQASNKAATYGTAFVAKLNSAGSALVYSTYLGGSTMDSGEAIALDSAGDAYLAGATWSSDFPTFIPLQPSIATKYAGSNAFVTKLNPAGSALVYSTYLGGSGHAMNATPSSGGDTAYGIAVDSVGVAFVAGLTGSADFPSVDALQSSNNSQDKFTAFVACLNSAGTALGYSTFLGGTGDDQANGIAVDASDNAYIAGKTTSPDFPTVSPLQATPGGVFVSEVSPPPAVTLFPTSLNFGTVPGNTMSQQRIVTLSSINNSAVNITSITASGDFSLTTTATSCPYTGGTMPAGATCTINVIFTPTATNTRTGDLAISYIGAGSPLSVPLTGVGIVSAVNVSPTSLTFSGQNVGTESTPQPVTLLNIGSVQLTVDSVAVTSGFQQNNNCLPTVAALASCTINVSFLPTATGPQTGTLTISDLAGNSPQTVALNGTGVGPAISLSATALSFPAQTVSIASSPQTITLSNPGTGALTPLLITPLGDFSQTNTCAGSVAAGSSCTISVTFTPTATGNRTGALTVTDNAAGSPQTVTLSGTGQDFALATSIPGAFSATIAPGQTATYGLVVNAESGFDGSVALACGGSPVASSCTFSQPTVMPGTPFTLIVTSTAPSVTSPRTIPPPRLPGPGVLLALVMLLICFAWTVTVSRRLRASWRVLPLALGLLLALALVSCGRSGPAPGSNHGTPTGTYNLKVTGTFTSGSATVSRSIALTLNVS